MCSLARAKYDNLAESPDELAFRRGDVLTVIDQVILLPNTNYLHTVYIVHTVYISVRLDSL